MQSSYYEDGFKDTVERYGIDYSMLKKAAPINNPHMTFSYVHGLLPALIGGAGGALIGAKKGKDKGTSALYGALGGFGTGFLGSKILRKTLTKKIVKTLIEREAKKELSGLGLAPELLREQLQRLRTQGSPMEHLLFGDANKIKSQFGGLTEDSVLNEYVKNRDRGYNLGELAAGATGAAVGAGTGAIAGKKKKKYRIF